MVYPTKKPTASTPTRPPRPSSSSVARTVSGSGLDALLFAASAATKSREVAGAVQIEGKCAEAKAKVQSTVVTIDRNGGVEEESSGIEGNEEGVFSFEYNPENPSVSLDVPQQAKTKNFPLILHEILSTPECQSIAHWLPDGFSFIIEDKQRFCDEILPTYFIRALFHSFVRKLNRWGFRRVKSRRKGEESSFAHKYFVRDKPGLCSEMQCKSKPSYHKAPCAKKKRKKAKVVAVKVAKSLSNAVVPSQSQAPSLVTPRGDIANGGSGCLPGPSTLSTTTATANVAAVGFPNATITAAFAPAIRARSFLASFCPQNPQQQIFLQRQFPIGQMRQGQDHLLQAELHRLREMTSSNDIHLRRNMMMVQYKVDLMRRNAFYN